MLGRSQSCASFNNVDYCCRLLLNLKSNGKMARYKDGKKMLKKMGMCQLIILLLILIFTALLRSLKKWALKN